MTSLFHRVSGLSRTHLRRLSPFVINVQSTQRRNASSGHAKDTFDPKMLDILVCPLSKKPLRYDAAQQELVSEELGVAYPIVDGIPDLNPRSGRMIKTNPDNGNS